MESLLRDLRHGVRALRQSPGFALSAVLSLGLGVGANTTVFAWMDNIVRNPFPGIPQGGALVAVNEADQEGRVTGMSPIAYPTLQEWRGRVRAFDDMAAHAQARLNLRSAPAALAEPVWVEMVASNFFNVLRVEAAIGRMFRPDDEAARAPVVVLSHAFWQRRFGGSSEVLGRALLFNGTPLTVVGIAPPRFDGAVMGLAFVAWVPLWQQRSLIPGADWLGDRQARRLQAVARLRPGVTLTQANRELLGVARDVSRSYGESPIAGAGARWVSDTQLGSLMGPLSLAMIAVTTVVLLSACANVAGLLLARSANRQRQTAIQVALGASRVRLVQQALVQGAVLSLAGCAVGLWIAGATKDILIRFVPRVALPVSLQIDLNWRVWLFAAIITTAATLLFALVPALRASRPDVVEALKASSTVGGRRSWLRHGLVVAQVAFSLVALSTAGLFLRSVTAAAGQPLGFGDPRSVLLAATDLSFARLTGDARRQLVDRMLVSARALPGVVQASAATAVPLSFGGPPEITTRVDGYVPSSTESMSVGRIVITDGYFETMEIPIVEGRSITRADGLSTTPVVFVNEAFVRRFWSGQSAIGRRIDQGTGWALVAGVVRDSAIDSFTEPPKPLAYYAFGQLTPDALTLHLKSRVEPMGLVLPLRRAMAAVHADLPVLDPRTLVEHMASATFVQSVGSAVFGVFGVVALLIVSTGLYGVMAGYVVERRRDMAVSVALGATPRTIAIAVVGPAVRLTIAGLVIGTALTFLVSSLVRNQLVGISPLDVLSLLIAMASLMVVTIATCAWPAWRAIHLDPMTIFRSQ